MERKDNQRSLAVGKEKTRRTLACERDDRRMDSWSVFAIRLLLSSLSISLSFLILASSFPLLGSQDEREMSGGQPRNQNIVFS